MPRFFTSAVQFDEAASVGSAVIDGEDGRHIARSLRMHTGDALTLSDGAGTDYTGEIESITGDTVMVRLTDKFKNGSEPTLRCHAVPRYAEGDKSGAHHAKSRGARRHEDCARFDFPQRFPAGCKIRFKKTRAFAAHRA